MELRPEQLQAVKPFCYCGFDLSVICPLQSIIDEQIAEIWEALRFALSQSSECGSPEVAMYSSGIRLATPTPKLTDVTVSDNTIILLSNGSAIGFFPANSIQ